MIDNHATDRYFYQILVFTGRRIHAGTRSKVSFVLYGDHDQTQVRTLADPHRSILQRGSIDAFVMSVPRWVNRRVDDHAMMTVFVCLLVDVCRSLGSLNCIRVWHDNSGTGASASWFLKYIIVRDLQTMDKFHFIAQRWFAVEEDDGRVSELVWLMMIYEWMSRLNVFYLLQVMLRNKHSVMFCPRKHITVCPMVICGFQSFLVHHRIRSLVCNDALVVSHCYLFRCCSISCTMAWLISRKLRLLPARCKESRSVRCTSQHNRFDSIDDRCIAKCWWEMKYFRLE